MPTATRIEREVRQRSPWNPLDLKLGFALLKDRRVPFHSKVGAFAIGFGALVLVAVLELPLEEILAAVLPFLGIAVDLVVDGIEAIVGPFVVACLVLPYLAPSTVVAQIRRERAGVAGAAEGPIIDV